MTAVILANGEIKNYIATKHALAVANFIVVADGGLRHAHSMGVIPHAIIGDMDSAPPEILEQMRELDSTTIVTYPTNKDETDLELALSFAWGHGAINIRVIGALGNRSDHALANMHLLATKPQQIELWDETTSIQLINNSLDLPKEKYDVLSLIPLTTEVTGIKTQGLTYPLNNETLKIGTTRGISNTFEKETATVSIGNGLLLAIRQKS